MIIINKPFKTTIRQRVCDRFNSKLTYFSIFASCDNHKMSLYHLISDQLQFVNPAFYKTRFFKKLNNLTAENVSSRNVEPELLWIREYLDRDAIVLEIGANVGAYLYQLEKTLPGENIYAFEPNKNLFLRLKRLFPKMHIVPVALSDENTTAGLKVPIIKGQEIPSRGTLNTSYLEKDEEKSVTQLVEVMKLDDWSEREKLQRIDFIKIDVEGNEMRTVRGAKQTILKFRPTLMVEIEQRHHDEPVWNLITEIEGWKYTAHYLDRQSFRLCPLSEDLLKAQNSADVKNKKNYINNIIFIPES